MPHLSRRFTLLRAPDGTMLTADAMRAHLRAQRARARAAAGPGGVPPSPELDGGLFGAGNAGAGGEAFLTEEEENEIIDMLRKQAKADPSLSSGEGSLGLFGSQGLQPYGSGTDGFGSWSGVGSLAATSGGSMTRGLDMLHESLAALRGENSALAQQQQQQPPGGFGGMIPSTSTHGAHESLASPQTDEFASLPQSPSSQAGGSVHHLPMAHSYSFSQSSLSNIVGAPLSPTAQQQQQQNSANSSPSQQQKAAAKGSLFGSRANEREAFYRHEVAREREKRTDAGDAAAAAGGVVRKASSSTTASSRHGLSKGETAGAEEDPAASMPGAFMGAEDDDQASTGASTREDRQDPVVHVGDHDAGSETANGVAVGAADEASAEDALATPRPGAHSEGFADAQGEHSAGSDGPAQRTPNRASAPRGGLLANLSPEAFRRVSMALDEVFGMVASEAENKRVIVEEEEELVATDTEGEEDEDQQSESGKPLPALPPHPMERKSSLPFSGSDRHGRPSTAGSAKATDGVEGRTMRSSHSTRLSTDSTETFESAAQFLNSAAVPSSSSPPTRTTDTTLMPDSDVVPSSDSAATIGPGPAPITPLTATAAPPIASPSSASFPTRGPASAQGTHSRSGSSTSGASLNIAPPVGLAQARQRAAQAASIDGRGKCGQHSPVSATFAPRAAPPVPSPTAANSTARAMTASPAARAASAAHTMSIASSGPHSAGNNSAFTQPTIGSGGEGSVSGHTTASSGGVHGPATGGSAGSAALAHKRGDGSVGSIGSWAQPQTPNQRLSNDPNHRGAPLSANVVISEHARSGSAADFNSVITASAIAARSPSYFPSPSETRHDRYADGFLPSTRGIASPISPPPQLPAFTSPPPAPAPPAAAAAIPGSALREAHEPSQSIGHSEQPPNSAGLLAQPPADPQLAQIWRETYGIDKGGDASSVLTPEGDEGGELSEDADTSLDEDDFWANLARKEQKEASTSARPVSHVPVEDAEQELAGAGITYDDVFQYQDDLVRSASTHRPNGLSEAPPVPALPSMASETMPAHSSFQVGGLSAPAEAHPDRSGATLLTDGGAPASAPKLGSPFPDEDISAFPSRPAHSEDDHDARSADVDAVTETPTQASVPYADHAATAFQPFDTPSSGQPSGIQAPYTVTSARRGSAAARSCTTSLRAIDRRRQSNALRRQMASRRCIKCRSTRASSRSRRSSTRRVNLSRFRKRWTRRCTACSHPHPAGPSRSRRLKRTLLTCRSMAGCSAWDHKLRRSSQSLE